MIHAHHRQFGGWASLMGTALLLGTLSWAGLPGNAWAVVDCSTVSPTSTADSDGDGLSDYVECHPELFTFAGSAGGFLNTLFTTCGTNPPDRKSCLDPNTKDGFLVYVPAASGSLFPAPSATEVYNGFFPLGVTVHLIGANLIAADRTVVLNQLAKSVKAAESLDINGTILGNCTWGTPRGTDGCVVYTQRILSFINSKCTTTKTSCPTSDTSTTCVSFRNYAKRTVFHEGAHSFGGLASTYDASAGGYHYPPPNKAANATVMDQYVTVSGSGAQCTFNVPKDTQGNWVNNWNTTLDPQSVKLQ
jgi:hypothetical protein